MLPSPTANLLPHPNAITSVSQPQPAYPSQQSTRTRLCDLGDLGKFSASLNEDWHVIGLEVPIPNNHWPGYKSSVDCTPCRIVGFIDEFPWPRDQSQSNSGAYIVETDGNEYAFQPLQIEPTLPPAVIHQIGLQPPPSRTPKNCEWDPYRRGFYDKTTGAQHLGTRSVASQDGRRVANAANMSSSRSDTYDLTGGQRSRRMCVRPTRARSVGLAARPLATDRENDNREPMCMWHSHRLDAADMCIMLFCLWASGI